MDSLEFDAPRTEAQLHDMLIDHISKGDPVDVANLAMMVWSRGESTVAPDSCT